MIENFGAGLIMVGNLKIRIVPAPYNLVLDAFSARFVSNVAINPTETFVHTVNNLVTFLKTFL